MKTNILFLVIVLFIASSCRTTKEAIKTASKINTEAKLDIQQLTETSHTADSTAVIADSVIVVNVTNEKITETYWSAPDSMGKQYPTKTTIVQRKLDTSKAAYSSSNTQTKTTDNGKSTVSDKSKLKSENKANASTNTETKTTTPTWVYILGLVLALVLIYSIYLILKRYNFIK